MKSNKSLTQILVVAVASLCIGLMVGSLIQSWPLGLAAFAVVLCVGLSPADFGLGRKRPKEELDDDEEL